MGPDQKILSDFFKRTPRFRADVKFDDVITGEGMNIIGWWFLDLFFEIDVLIQSLNLNQLTWKECLHTAVIVPDTQQIRWCSIKEYYHMTGSSRYSAYLEEFKSIQGIKEELKVVVYLLIKQQRHLFMFNILCTCLKN